jgi:hypothetical protein
MFAWISMLPVPSTFYRSRGFAVLLPEYRGYARSAGTPSQKAIREDAAKFYERLIARPDVDKSRIVYSGRSVGSGVAADFASHHKPAAMVLVSPFLSASSMAWEYYAPPLLVRNPYRTDEVLRELDVPVVIFHGKRDEIIPFRHGQELCKLTKRGKLVEYDCGHNDFPGAGNQEAFDQAVERFLAEAGLIRD